MTLSKTLTTKAKKYADMNNLDKEAFLTEAYKTDQASFKTIADAVGTYPNKVRRDASKLGIVARDRAEAQTVAIATGRHEHPTKGKERSLETKIKISEGRAAAWENLSPTERQHMSEIGKAHWNSMSEAEKKNLQRAAGDAIRKASKEGSKLEKFLQTNLISAGYRVEFHKEHTLKNTRLQIDLWLPELAVAIEVDGPSHASPIWGEKAFARNQKADDQKTGLILGSGAVLMRVLQNRSFSQKFQRDILSDVLETLGNIKAKFPPRSQRNITIGEQ